MCIVLLYQNFYEIYKISIWMLFCAALLSCCKVFIRLMPLNSKASHSIHFYTSSSFLKLFCNCLKYSRFVGLCKMTSQASLVCLFYNTDFLDHCDNLSWKTPICEPPTVLQNVILQIIEGPWSSQVWRGTSWCQ